MSINSSGSSTDTDALRWPLKRDSLLVLRDLGFEIRTVLDVGVMTCTPELMTVFGDARHLLFEPIEEWNPRIRENYGSRGILFELVNVAVSSSSGSISMKVSSVRPGAPITHARMVRDAPEDEHHRTVPMETLDRLTVSLKAEPPYLLKVDVDGAELDVLDGALSTLKHTEIVVVEAQVRNFIERGGWLAKHGFELFDVVDLCYYDRRLAQFDMVFVRTSSLKHRGLEIYRRGFDIARWAPFKR